MYRLETTTGEVYETKQLTRTETGFRVVPRTRVGKGRSGHWENSEPVQIAFENVKSLQSIDRQEGRSLLLVMGAPVMVLAVIAGIVLIDLNN